MDTSSKVVYLTFDDGPVPEVTPALLDLLQEKGVHATFFMVAENARRYPDLLKRVNEEGHAIGNHTLNHCKGKKCTTKEYLDNIEEADMILGGTCAFRPPYGKFTHAQKVALLDKGYSIYLWDVLTHDYNKNYSPERMMQIIKRYTRNGSIINFHDSVKSGERMLQTVAEAIDWLKAQGYEFGVVDELGMEEGE